MRARWWVLLILLVLIAPALVSDVVRALAVTLLRWLLAFINGVGVDVGVGGGLSA